MDRDRLEAYLSEGLSLPQIGEIVGRDPSTVGYWVAKHGLVANGKAKYAPRGGLSREQLEPLVEQGLSQNEIARRLDRSLSTVRHWLKKHGLQTRPYGRRKAEALAAKAAGLDRFTSVCMHHGETEFRVLGAGRARCGRCASDAVVRRRRKIKEILIEEFGGCCQLCGYDRCPAALQFHHIDPSLKEFSVSRSGITRAFSEVLEEAKKCILLCANCHAEVEAGFRTLEDFDQLSMRL